MLCVWRKAEFFGSVCCAMRSYSNTYGRALSSSALKNAGHQTLACMVVYRPDAGQHTLTQSLSYQYLLPHTIYICRGMAHLCSVQRTRDVGGEGARTAEVEVRSERPVHAPTLLPTPPTEKIYARSIAAHPSDRPGAWLEPGADVCDPACPPTNPPLAVCLDVRSLNAIHARPNAPSFVDARVRDHPCDRARSHGLPPRTRPCSCPSTPMHNGGSAPSSLHLTNGRQRR